MRAFRLGLAALGLSLALGACSEKSGALAPVKTTPAAVEALVAKLSTESFKGKATAASDIASVRDVLPREVSLTWTALNFDAASGATVLTGVKLTPTDSPEIGIAADEVRLWDFDAAFARARLTGQRITETASLARRIDAKGVSVFGIETLMAPAMDAYSGAVSGALAEIDPAAASAAVMQLDDYEFSIGRVILDDLMLRPYELKLAQLPPDSEFAAMLPALQTYFAVSRTFAANAIAVLDFKAKMAMTQNSEPLSMDMSAASYGMRGVRGSDVDAAVMRDLAFNMSMAMPQQSFATGGPTMTTAPMNMQGAIASASIQEMRLDKLAGYVARGEWPPRTEADLMSYGVLTMQNERIVMNGHNVYSIGEVSIDARKWHWLVPTKLRIASKDVVYDIKALMEFSAEMTRVPSDPNDPASPTVPMMPIDPQVMEMLTRYGLDKPSIDTSFGWDWNPETGATAMDGAFELDGYMAIDGKYTGGFPSFMAVSDLVPDDINKADPAAISDVFAKAATLKSAEINVVDKGGLEKIYGLSAEIAKMAGATAGTGGNVAANLTPQGMRQMAVAGVYMAADQGSQEIPQLRDLLTPVALFLEKGGELKITLKPQRPMVYATAGQSVTTGAASPVSLISELNAKVVHTPPPGAK
ncbi:MAG: hypothetical protein Q8R02_07240 [Hyphomonadaceae bacterium]|nr:hypothetical protein [Hyphomonadaceae bacterium]